MCRPTIIPDIDDQTGEITCQPSLIIKDMYHPSLLMKNEKIRKKRLIERKNRIAQNMKVKDDDLKKFIPNSTYMGTE
jgi:uncharacterized FlgJ-related protein